MCTTDLLILTLFLVGVHWYCYESDGLHTDYLCMHFFLMRTKHPNLNHHISMQMKMPCWSNYHRIIKDLTPVAEVRG